MPTLEILEPQVWVIVGFLLLFFTREGFRSEKVRLRLLVLVQFITRGDGVDVALVLVLVDIGLGLVHNTLEVAVGGGNVADSFACTGMNIWGGMVRGAGVTNGPLVAA